MGDILNRILTDASTSGEMSDVVGGILGFAVAVLVVAVVIILIVYVVLGIFLTKFHKLLYGKGSVCAWIPIANTYLLGKLTFNKTVGWILVVATFLTSEITTTVNGVSNKFSVIPQGSTIFFIVRFALFIYAIIKYGKIKKGEINKEVAAYQSNQFSFNATPPTTNTQQPMNNTQPVNNTAPMNNDTMQNPTQPQTRFCTNCGTQAPSDANVCSNCGQPLQ